MQQFQKVLLRKTFVGCKYALVEEILKKILRLQVLIAKFRFCNHPQRKMHPVFCIFMHPSNEALKRKGSLYILGPESESLCKRFMGTFSYFHYKGPYFDNQTSLPVFSRCQMFCIILFFLPCLHVQNLHQYSFQVYIFSSLSFGLY